MVEIRREIHCHPELGFKEYQTSKLICSELEHLGIKYKKGIAQTGVVGEIGSGVSKGKCVALRADMDALPIQKNRPALCLQEPRRNACLRA